MVRHTSMPTLSTYVVLFSVLLMNVQVPAQQATSDAAAPPVLTLDDAVKMATSQNKQLQATGLDVVKARENVAQTKTALYPQLQSYVLAGYELDKVSFTVPVGAFGVYPATGPIPGSPVVTTPAQFAAYIYAYAGQPVSQLYKVNLAVREARLGVDVANQEVRAQHQEVTRRVREEYRELAQMQSTITSAEASVKYLSDLSDLTDRSLKVEAVVPSEAMTVRAKLKMQRYQLLTLRDGFDLKKEAFNRLLGRDVRTQFSVEPQPPADSLELDLEAARRLALEQRPEIRQARLQRQMAELDVRREKAEYIPDLSLQLSYVSFQNVAFLPQNVASAGFAFSWQPFDFGYKKHRIGELRATASQKRLSEEDATQTVILDVDTKYRKLNEARTLLDANAEMQAADQRKLQEMTHLYEQKSILLSDLLQQQAVVSQAESQYQQALAAFWAARADFERAVGQE
jgi:outer membrane protein